MLEKAIEIEGLLRIIRDGQPLPETYQLLKDKAARLADQAVALQSDSATSQPEPTPIHSDFVMAATITADPKPKVDFSSPEDEPKEKLTAHPMESTTSIADDVEEITEDDIDLSDEDDIILSFDDSSDTSAVSGSTVLPPASGHPAVGDSAGNAIPEPRKETDETDTEASAAPKRQLKLKSVFSLNDRFLYARELFEGNMKMFDSTLEFLEGIDDYSIIEDYFYSELDWDPENRDVAAFMDILRPHFKE